MKFSLAIQTVFVIVLNILLAVSTAAATSSSHTVGSKDPWSLDGGRWFKGELHKHSWLYGGIRDLGDLVYNLKQLGYDFVFQGDHDWGKLNGYNFTESFDITDGTLTDMRGDEWDRAPSKVPPDPCSTTAGIAELSSTLAHRGSRSMHLSLNSQAFTCNALWWDTIYHDEGVSFARGPIMLNFSYFPVTYVEGSSGFAVHFYINVRAVPLTITLSDNRTVPTGGTARGGGTVEFAVYSGVPPFADSQFKRAFRLDPPPVLGRWNTYSFNLSELIPQVFGFSFHPTAGPFNVSVRDYSSGNSTSEFYLDDFYLYNHHPLTHKQVEAWKNTIIHTWDTPDFKVFGTLELSYLHHINYLNFEETNPGRMVFSDEMVPPGPRNDADVSKIVDWVHAQGYPAQLNHPLTGADPLPFMGWGADVMDVISGTSTSGGYNITNQNEVLRQWDGMLSQGAWILEDAVSDSGTVGTDSFITKAAASYIYSDALERNSLVKSLYEGRLFIARQTYGGRIVFNIEPSDAPYPARYPVYISYDQNDANVKLYLHITNMKPSWTVNWIRNGTLIGSESGRSGNFESRPTFGVPDNANYFRAEIRDTSPSCDQCLIATTNPILFKKTDGLPKGMRFMITDVSTTSGIGYNRPTVRGITAVSNTASTLNLDIAVPNGATSTILVESPTFVSAVSGTDTWNFDSGEGIGHATTSGPNTMVLQHTGTSVTRPKDQESPPKDHGSLTGPILNSGLVSWLLGDGRLFLVIGAMATIFGVGVLARLRRRRTSSGRRSEASKPG